ncbi:hypothetical protein GF327_02675 [Candidatus Woesearchaeota archaeon]|nr:hypothetical protein [Candidatus Woesearchaeota archaeon]
MEYVLGWSEHCVMLSRTFLYYRAVFISGLSHTMPLLSFTPVFVSIIGIFILNESLNIFSVLNILMIVSGAYVLNISRFKQGIFEPFAYIFRKKGVQVVFGGMHTTANPKKVLKHCNASVVGEAEEIWPKVIKDFENNKLKNIYSQDKPVDIDSLPMPDLSIIDWSNYTFLSPIQASRGCIHKCKFCFSKTINPTYRNFPVKYVYEQAKRAKYPLLGFMVLNPNLE